MNIYDAVELMREISAGGGAFAVKFRKWDRQRCKGGDLAIVQAARLRKKASDEKIGNSCDSTPEENAGLVDNRNADWLTKMPEIMKKAPTFFVVGALHLPGEKGVLQLLKNAGYTVEPVK